MPTKQIHDVIPCNNVWRGSQSEPIHTSIAIKHTVYKHKAWITLNPQNVCLEKVMLNWKQVWVGLFYVPIEADSR